MLGILQRTKLSERQECVLKTRARDLFAQHKIMMMTRKDVSFDGVKQPCCIAVWPSYE